MQKQILCIFVLIVCVYRVYGAVQADIVAKVPGYPETFKTPVYAGYLNTSSESRSMHYVFVEAQARKNNTTVPLTLWLNGGPGCSSLLGFIQEIGPYFLEEGKHYKVGDVLKENPYSWNKLSNLLFIQSPAGVGYSLNKNSSFEYNDISTANDNFASVLDFFRKFPELTENDFWIAGESYAGKYIPDLAVLINAHNEKENTTKINLKGLFIGNGVMSFQGNQLQKSELEYMIDHEFVDPELITYYERSCKQDQASAGCQYFKTRFAENVNNINPYNVYSYCFYNDSFESPSSKKQFFSQESILKQFAQKGSFDLDSSNGYKNFNGAPCAFFDGIYEYFNAHVDEFHAEKGMEWAGPCVHILYNTQNEKISAKYKIDQSGSMSQYRQLINMEDKKYHIILYNGDWDDVVPFTDTIKNLEKLNLSALYLYQPWFVNDQHAGFSQHYQKIIFVTVKGASHQVPQSKRAEAFYLIEQAFLEPQKQRKAHATVTED